jgi:proteasome lid subunit RPN8/RPN11
MKAAYPMKRGQSRPDVKVCQRYNPLSMATTDLSLKLPRHIFDEIIAQAGQQQPRECCGLLGGLALGCDMIARHRYPLRNRSPHPETRYFAAPEDLFDAMRQMRAAAEDLIGIYHSHPHGSAFPSPSDIKSAFYPNAVYLIVVLDPKVELKAFSIKGQAVTEVGIEIIE